MKKLFLFFALLLSGCTGVPEGITVVDDFSLDRFLGTWYEVARIDNSFEKKLEQVSAKYTLANDGSVKVLNKGYDTNKNKWKTIEGRGVFIGDTHKGALKVSFFGPFYASYNVIELDKVGYRWAMVCGRDRSYFWILSREPEMDSELLKELVSHAKSFGFDMAHLHYLSTQP
ncbi:MAG: lipocalin family protein [Chlorobiales bacterium]|nr:lipocalin family protein [Chlorobiales bacterium]